MRKWNSITLRLGSVALGLILSLGCAQKIRLQVMSDPPGATIIAHTVAPMRTPMYLTYTVKPEYVSSTGCFRAGPITAQWPSGTSRSLDWLPLCPATQTEQTYRFVHPGGDTLAFDTQAGFQWLQVQGQRAIAAGIERNARMQGYKIIQDTIQNSFGSDGR